MLEACSDTDALLAGVTPPLEAAARAQVQTPTAAYTAAELDAGKLDTRPGFRLPFGCGETWQITYQAHHPRADSQIDFYLPDQQPPQVLQCSLLHRAGSPRSPLVTAK